jgi:hypothetical protein
MKQQDKLKILRAKREAQERAATELKERHDEIVGGITALVEKISSLPEQIKDGMPELTLDSIEVKNLDSLESKLQTIAEKVATPPEVTVESKQDLTEINKTFSKVLTLIKELKDKEPEIIVQNNIELPTEPKDAIPVVLVDREKKRFYEAISRAVSSGGGIQPNLIDDNRVRITGDIAVDNSDVIDKLKDVQGFQIPKYDEIDLEYDDGNVSKVEYSKDGTLVATITLSYTNGNLTKVVQS